MHGAIADLTLYGVLFSSNRYITNIFPSLSGENKILFKKFETLTK